MISLQAASNNINAAFNYFRREAYSVWAVFAQEGNDCGAKYIVSVHEYEMLIFR